MMQNAASGFGRIRRPVPRRPLLFIALEASSRSGRSWPMEFAYAWTGGGRVFVRSTLIAPRSDWARDDWSERAEHGIDLEMALTGRPADEVAAETDALGAFDIVSGDADMEGEWLQRLRGDAAPRLEVLPFTRLVPERLGEAVAEGVMSYLNDHPPGRRAGPNAARLAAAWAAGTERSRQAA
jgi:hypothetical protein